MTRTTIKKIELSKTNAEINIDFNLNVEHISNLEEYRQDLRDAANNCNSKTSSAETILKEIADLI